MINKKIIEFEEKTIECYVLEKIDDFSKADDNFLNAIEDIDKELKIMLNDNIIDALNKMIILMPFPLTIIYEPYYVDRIYRDEYYAYYSRKHFGISRNTKRMVFLKGRYYRESIIDSNYEMQKKIEHDLIGMVVIKPTQTIGRTLISPFNLNIRNCFVRTTTFDISILGKIYKLEAFPLSGQDSEVMTCAEVNMWQIMEYFGTRYSNYRTLLPSEMLELISKTSDVRLLPSDGLTVEQESNIFKNSGLSPKIYYKWLQFDGVEYVETYEPYINSPSLEEILHFYVESGIPVLINLREKDNREGINHSVTCIGHAENDVNAQLSEVIFEDKKKNNKEEKTVDKYEEYVYNKLTVLKSWSACGGYVFMEDHSAPYQIRNLDDLKFGDDEKSILYEIESFVVPLYKHVFMAAEDAYKIVIDVIDESWNSIADCLNRSGGFSNDKIVIRLFLTTSRSYKQFRSTNTSSVNERVFFSQIVYPKFIWVCEYGSTESYANHKAIGEIIIDATAFKNSVPVISIRHGNAITYRGPDDPDYYAMLRRDIPIDNEFVMFEQYNLKCSNKKGDFCD